MAPARRTAFLIVFLSAVASILRGEEAAPAFQAGKAGQLQDLPLPDPEPFKTKDGKSGWKIKIPGDRPLATPAVVDGILYVGGGFGSHEFYALDARTGKRVWTFMTGDDGPTAAVVAEGCVAYNTESCTIYVHEARTGRLLWSSWLGDPLMSQPAIAGGRLFMAYPKQQHHLAAFELKTGKVLWNQPIAAEVISAPVVDGASVYAATCDGTLYRFDAATGKPHWAKSVQATSAPVIVDGQVRFSQRIVREIEVTVGEGEKRKTTKSEATLEGFNAAAPGNGELAFKEPQAAVPASYLASRMANDFQLHSNYANTFSGQFASRFGAARAAVVVKDFDANPAAAPQSAELQKKIEAYQKSEVAKTAEGGEQDAARAKALADELDRFAKSLPAAAPDPAAPSPTDQLKAASAELRASAEKTDMAAKAAKDIQVTLTAQPQEEAKAQQHDTGVAFATAPAEAKLGMAGANIGQQHVKSVWAFQGSRPLPYKKSTIAVQGTQVRALDPVAGKALWETRIESKVAATRPASPPALAGGKLYMATADGRILCDDPDSGKRLWDAEVGGHILFQPAVAGGRVYAATDDGSLICLETGDAAADGWTMWGGSAAHNGPAK
jgi:outer membrane protein assembly factor BamB